MSTASPAPDESEAHPHLNREYWCFISYRHADNTEPGRQWATWLHQALETYEVPADLVGTENERGDTIPERIFPVFRDEEELPADAELSKPIEAALKRSRFLVALCSPQAVQSRFVADEILRFKQLGKQDRILAAIIEGEPNASDDPAKGGAHKECFPHPLRFSVDERGQLTDGPTEPIAADFRLPDGTSGWTSPVAYREVLRASGLLDKQFASKLSDYTKQQSLMLLKIIAGVIGVPLGVLTQRDKAYQLEKQQQRAKVLRRWLFAVGALGLLAVGAFLFARHTLEEQDELLWQASRADHEAATNAIRDGRNSEGLAYLDRALRYRPMNTAALEAVAAHAFGISVPMWPTRRIFRFEWAVNCVVFNHDGRYFATGSNDKTARVFEVATGKEISKTEFDSLVTLVSFSPDGRFLAAGSRDKTARVIEMETGKEVSRTDFGDSVASLSAVESLSFSPDGRLLAVGGTSDETGEKGEARVIEAKTGKAVLKMEFGEEVDSLSFSPDGFLLAVGSRRFNEGNVFVGEARLIEVATGKEISKTESGGFVSSLSFSPDGRFLAVGGTSINDMDVASGVVHVIEVVTGKQKSKTNLKGGVNAVSFSPDGGMFAVGSDYDARLIETETGKEISKVKFEECVNSVSFSPDGRLLAVGSDDNTARVMEAATGQEISRTDFGDQVNSVCFSPDGRYFAAGSTDNTARLMEASMGQEISRTDFGGNVNSVSFSPDGRYIATGTDDKTARVFEATTGKDISKTEFGHAVNSVSFSPDGRLLAVGSDDKTARVIEAATGKEIRRMEFGVEVMLVSFSPDGRWLAAACGEFVGDNINDARVIDVATGKEISRMDIGDEVTFAKFSPDCRFLVAGSSWTGPAQVIELAAGKPIRKSELGNEVESVSFSPDGRFIAVGSSDGMAQVIEAATAKEICRTKFGNVVNSVSFSPDGRCFAAGSLDQSVRVIEATTGKEISRAALGGWVLSVSFSPNGRLLAVGSGDGTASVIEVATGKQISRTEFYEEVVSLSFSPDGRYLVAGSDDHTVRMIDYSWINQRCEISNSLLSALRLQSSHLFQPDGRLAPMSADELLAAQRDVAAFILAEPKASERWQHAILKWSQIPPDQRTTSPWTYDPIRNAIGRWLVQAHTNTPTITDCADQAPWHPLVPVSLARLEPKPYDENWNAAQGTVRPTFLAHLTLKRLREADEKLYGRETLAEYAAWSARIMHEELHLDPEAREALAFALERIPPEKQKDLLELKAKLTQ